MFINSKFLLSLFKYLIFLTSISIFLIFCGSETNQDQYNGPWVEVPTPAYQGQLNACYFTSPDNGWACGYRGDGPYPILIHWNGIEWVEYPYGGWFDNEQFYIIHLEDISFSASNDGWCVGLYSISGEGTYGFILKYDGNEWYLFKKDIGDALERVYCIATDDVWFSGFENMQFKLYHWNGSELEEYYIGSEIFGIAFSSPTEGLAVGYYYSVYHWDGVSWAEIDIDHSYNNPNRSVCYDTPNSAFIVGENRTARWNNGEYKYNDIFYVDYRDIHLSSPDNGWKVGSEDRSSWIWYFDGNVWERNEAPSEMFANSVFSINKNEAWIVGENRKKGICSSWRYSVEK